jgi:hypothetical protein
MGKRYVFHGFIEHFSLFSAVEVSQRPVLFYFVRVGLFLCRLQ